MTDARKPTPGNQSTPGSQIPGSADGIAIGALKQHGEMPIYFSAKLGLLITFALIAVGWSKTFYEMWQRWFPAWLNTSGKLTIMERLSEGSSYYTHGPLVPLTSLLIAYLIYKRAGVPIQRSRGATLIGWTTLVIFLCVHLLSVYARVTFVSGFALVGALLGLMLIWGGSSLVRAYWLPVLFLAFMVPLPMSLIAQLNLQLKFVAGSAAVWLTNELFGIPALMNNSLVYLPADADGMLKLLVLEDVCSGLRSLISLTCFAVLFALVCRTRGVWRLFMLAVAVPVAVACNILRITFLNLVAHYGSIDAAAEGGAAHDWSGIFVFVVALAMLFGLETMIVSLGNLFKRNWTDPRLLAFLDRIPRAGRATLRTLRPGVLTVMSATAVLSLVWSQASVAQYRGDFARHAVPSSLHLSGEELNGQDLDLEPNVLIILETDDYLYRQFVDAWSRPKVDLLIVFSQNNRKGTHPPEVCLAGGADQIIKRQLHDLNIEDLGQVAMRELVIQDGRLLTYHLYVYKCGDAYTPDFFAQQARIFLNGLRNRNVSGALIRFTVPVQRDQVDDARKIAFEAAKQLMPKIDQRLP